MKKFQNKYRIPSVRLQTWDYGANGSYFITICTKNREHFFGKIINDEMELNEMGQLAEQFWAEIPIHFPYVELGNFVVMPNHTHGILIIDKNANVVEHHDVVNHDDVEPRLIAALPPQNEPSKRGGATGDYNPMFYDNISRIIRWYKGRCTFEIRNAPNAINRDFTWQSRFHDHIIRNNESFERIQTYIANNPANWNKDKFY
jgi:putative transposase